MLLENGILTYNLLLAPVEEVIAGQFVLLLFLLLPLYFWNKITQNRHLFPFSNIFII